MRGEATSRGSRKNWKNSRALFARDREYAFALVRQLHYYIPLKTRLDEVNSTKKTNNSRLISTLARLSRSMFHEGFLRLHRREVSCARTTALGFNRICRGGDGYRI